MQVLIVDDDESIRELVRTALEVAPLIQGVEVLEAGDATSALAIIGSVRIDVAVLDVGLPDISGLDLLGHLHARDPETRILMLSGAAAEGDRVAGLLAGADDYMVKPFSLVELAARVLALSRRRAAPETEVMTFGNVRVDLASREVMVGEHPVELTRREFDLLAFFVTHPSRTYTRDELLRGAFTSSAEWQSEATITEHIRRLRLKIEEKPACPTHLLTVRGLGYRFDAGVPTMDLLPSNAHTSLDATFVSLDNAIVHVSRAALDLIGIDGSEEVVGRNLFEFVAAGSLAHATSRRQVLTEGRVPRPQVLGLNRADGREVVVQLSSTPVLWNGQAAIQVTLWELDEESP